MTRTAFSTAAAAWLLSVLVVAEPGSVAQSNGKPAPKKMHHAELFVSSEDCLACHNGMRSGSGEDVSIGADWRASMMANSGRDPYWIARGRTWPHPG